MPNEFTKAMRPTRPPPPGDKRDEATIPSDTADSIEYHYLFRGDDTFRGGAVGLSFGVEADAADIQDFADHVLRKESHRMSRYVSFTMETAIARKFTSAPDNRYVRKVEWAVLRDLEAQGVIKIWPPEAVYLALRQGPKKLARQAADVRAAMRKNRELLIEGQIHEGALQSTN